MAQRRTGSSSLVKLLGNWHQDLPRTPVYRQLADGLRLLILDGRLPLDSRLPGERELATTLGVSRTTVATALAQLRDEGYLASRQGSGSVTMLPEGGQTVSRYRALPQHWISPRRHFPLARKFIRLMLTR